MLRIKVHRVIWIATHNRVFFNSSQNADVDVVDVDVVDLRAQADASMPASNNNVSYTVYSNF